jgi:hypothetical protein
MQSSANCVLAGNSDYRAWRTRGEVACWQCFQAGLALTGAKHGARIAQTAPLAQCRTASRRLGLFMDISTHAAPVPERRLRAWAFSVLFHTGWISLLAVTVEQAPRGAADEPGRTAGIVLKRSSAEGDLYEGEEDLAPSEPSSQPLPPADLIAALPSESAAAEIGADLPQLPVPGPGATQGGGQPDAGAFTGGGGGRTGSLGGGGQTQVSVFGVEGTGTKFVYVFDRSSSMEGAPLAAAKRQLIESLAALEEIHQFQIIFFNHETDAFTVPGSGRRIAYANDRNKQLAANFIGGISADGGTDRYTALRQAVALGPDVVFFLTDADDPMAASELAQIERANRRNGAAICVIEFGRRSIPPQQNFLIDLARSSGGQYGYVNTLKLAD